MAVTRLRLALLEMKAPQYVVAAASRIHPSQLSEYALGKKRIPPRHLIQLAAVLECEPQDLVGYADIPDPEIKVG